MRSARTIPSAPSTFSCHVYPHNARPWFRGCSPVVSCSRYSGRLSKAREPVLSGRIVELFGDSVATRGDARSEEHTSELQSQSNLVCRLLLEKKKAEPTFCPRNKLNC